MAESCTGGYIGHLITSIPGSSDYFNGGIIAYAAAWIVMPDGGPASAAAPGSSRRLMRSTTERKIAGVCGGIAEYFAVDPTAIRVLWVILSIVPGTLLMGLVAYVVAWFIMPERQAGTIVAAPTAA